MVSNSNLMATVFRLVGEEHFDRAEFLESKTPSSELQAFTQLVIMVGLKALDIPILGGATHCAFVAQDAIDCVCQAIAALAVVHDRVLEPVEVGGVTVPTGAQVIISLAAANRDGRHYAQADEIDLGRAASRHLAFGHGIHFCLGAPLARMEGHLALGSLLRRFPALRLAVPRDALHWGHGDGLVLRGLSELPVIPGPAAS